MKRDHLVANVVVILGFLLLTACGAGENSEPNWYYHFICNGDSECLSTNFAGSTSGTSSQGPGAGGQSGCNSLLQFGSRFWNIPPAQQWCDNSSTFTTPPGGGGGTPPAITSISPNSGAPGTSVTITGSNFSTSVAENTVTVGAVEAVITSASSTQLVITIPSVGGSTNQISVVTPGGTATSSDAFTVIVPNPLGNTLIKKIAPGVNHACAILADDTVKCWGSNQLGQLGNGSTATTADAVTVLGIANAIDIASGNAFSCAVVGAASGATAGSVMCWGNGTSGQLGNNSNSSSSTPVAVSSLGSATQVSARAIHACALLSSGQVVCWGDGTSGQLGSGAMSSSAIPVAVLGTGADNYSIVNAQGEPASTKAFQVSAGNAHTCARVSTSSGSAGLGVKCWGATNYGELGNGATLCPGNTICDPKNPNPVPQRVSSLTNAADLAAGGHHTCVVLTTGGAKCWGLGDQGQLGNGAGTRSSTPVTVSGLSGATRASGGNVFSCVSVSGTLKCWGGNDSGQLGNATTANSPVPVTVTAISAGDYDPDTLKGGDMETCMKRGNGTAFCFP